MELTTTAMAIGGDAVARDADGRVVFVTGALPGERVRVALTEEKKDFARARVVEVLDPSPDRVTAPCSAVALGCGGCGWQHIALDAQRRLKVDVVGEALSRMGGVKRPDVRPATPLPDRGFRVTVRVAAGPGGRAGFRRAASNDVVVPERCLVADPEVEAQRVALVDLTEKVERQLRPAGEGGQTFTVAGRQWQVSPGSFFQARLDGAEELVRLVLDAAAGEPPRRAADLYCGVGLFAGVLADRGWQVEGVEANKAAVADARVNLAGDDARVVRKQVADWRSRLHALVVADPGRPGLARPGAAAVFATETPTIVLVSCDAASLGRDARLLTDAGYRLDHATLVDMFPHTPHVEVVSKFTRVELTSRR